MILNCGRVAPIQRHIFWGPQTDGPHTLLSLLYFLGLLLSTWMDPGITFIVISSFISYNNDNNAINIWKPTWLLWLLTCFSVWILLHRRSFILTTQVQSLLVLPPFLMYFTILVFPNCVLVGRVDILVRKYWSYFGGKFQHSGPRCLPPQRVTGFTFPRTTMGTEGEEKGRKASG